MSYQGVVFRRLDVMFNRLKPGESFRLQKTWKLGTGRLGFGDGRLGEIHGYLGQVTYGFKDVLGESIPRSAVKSGTTCEDLAKTIVKKSCVTRVGGRCSNSLVGYRKQCRGLLLEGRNRARPLVELIADAMPSGGPIGESDRIPDLVPTAAGRNALRAQIQSEYQKYLLNPLLTMHFGDRVSLLRRALVETMTGA